VKESYFTTLIRKLGEQNQRGFVFSEREAGGARSLFKFSKSIRIQWWLNGPYGGQMNISDRAAKFKIKMGHSPALPVGMSGPVKDPSPALPIEGEGAGRLCEDSARKGRAGRIA
jgi:hypothetical protein